MASQTSKRPSNRSPKKATRRTTGSGSRSKAKNPQYKDHPSNGTALSMVQYEIIAMLVLACALFFMISIYFNGGGIVGEFTKKIFFGIFGISAWLLPIGIFTATFLKIFNKGNERLNIKLLLSFFIIVFISVINHIFSVKGSQINIQLVDQWAIFATLANYFHVSSIYLIGGGFIGGLIGDVLMMFVGKIGALVVLVVLFISLMIAITEQSFLLLMKKAYMLIVVYIKKFMEYLGARSEARKEQRKVRAFEREREAQLERQRQKEAAELAEIQKQVDPSTTQSELMEEADSNTGQEREEKAKKKGLVASLFTSTLRTEEEFDIVEQIEEKEAIEQEENEEMFTNLFEEAKEEESKEANQEIQDTTHELMKVNKESEKESDEVAVKRKSKKESLNKEEIESGKKEIEQEILKEVIEVEPAYKKPPLELLKVNPASPDGDYQKVLDENAAKLEETLASFGVGAKVIDVAMGPSVTRYELQPDQGVKVSKIVNLSDDIALNLAASGIRIEAPIPGKSAVGIEVPNKDVTSVYLREVLDTVEFEKFSSKVAFGLGKDISGKVIVTDIARMPHLLIAGATGSGKSVCVNTLITSILYKSSPEDVKLLMIDPKVVELSIYNGIPHLLIPVVTDPKKAANALNWAVQEMLDRYKLFAEANVRDIKGYNKAIEKNTDGLKKLPQIVIIVDELADLMVAAAGDVEEAICRLAQMARAAGLHLIIATQRPSVDVITGLIKANIPSRIAFNVSSGTDSRTIIDMNGAEKLLGKGDMLFYPVGLQKPIRVQGAFVSDKEIENIVTYLKDRKKQEYDEKIMKQLDRSVSESAKASDDYDPIFEEVLELCVDKGKASASMIQRRFRVGYNRAARILDQLHEGGYVSDDEGSKPRRMLLTKEEFEAMKRKANGEEETQAQTADSSSEELTMEINESKEDN